MRLSCEGWSDDEVVASAATGPQPAPGRRVCHVGVADAFVRRWHPGSQPGLHLAHVTVDGAPPGRAERRRTARRRRRPRSSHVGSAGFPG